jgi:hypothetical protein
MKAAHRTVLCAALAASIFGTLATAPTRADPPDPASGGSASAADVASRSLPQSAVFSSVGQSWKGADDDVVYGHFDLGAPPSTRRFYCLVDAKNGKREPNGVLGDLFVKKDGSTAIHMISVSLYTCVDALRAGYLETSGYKLTGKAASSIAASIKSLAPAAPAATTASAAPTAAPTGAPAGTPAGTPAAEQAAAATAPASTAAAPSAGAVAPSAVAGAVPGGAASARREGPGAIDVAGVRLGMSAEEARVAVKGRGLLNYFEALGVGRAAGAAPSEGTAASGARFLSRIAAWSVSDAAGDGEAIEVLFTPAPGHERAYAIVHSVGYASAHAVRQVALDALLVKKYGGYNAGEPLPASPTWRLQRNGKVEAGDECELRGLFGGLHDIAGVPTEHSNVVLNTPLNELQSQADRCGIAIVTEDHLSNGSAMREARRVARFTVTAYSPAIALEGLRLAAQNRVSGDLPPVASERGASLSPGDL